MLHVFEIGGVEFSLWLSRASNGYRLCFDNTEQMVSLDHDDFGRKQSKIMNVIDSNNLERDAGGKPASTCPHPALAGGCLRIDGVEYPVHVANDGDRLFVHLNGEVYEIAYRDPVTRYAARAGSGSENVLRAPMPGAVVAVSVTAGQAVKEGDILLVIESMKLETAIRAPRDGIVEAVHVSLSKSFERDAPLVSLAVVGQPT